MVCAVQYSILFTHDMRISQCILYNHTPSIGFSTDTQYSLIIIWSTSDLPWINLYHCSMHEKVNSYIRRNLTSPLFLHYTYILYISNKDIPIYFVSRKILLEAAQLQNQCISLSIHVYCTCTPHGSVANQVWAHDVHHSCVMCVHWQSCACQICMQQCMCTPIF